MAPTRRILGNIRHARGGGPVGELLSGGWYFATETARIVDGALLPEDGADLLRARMTIEVRP